MFAFLTSPTQINCCTPPLLHAPGHARTVRSAFYKEPIDLNTRTLKSVSTFVSQGVFISRSSSKNQPKTGLLLRCRDKKKLSNNELTMATSVDSAKRSRLTTLKNRIFLVRHGQSESNVQYVLISDPKDGVTSYGLTDEGKKQAKEACSKLESLIEVKQDEALAEKLVVISSDFKRTAETATIIHGHFQVKAPLRLEPALRERGFGGYNRTSEGNAAIVFKRDYEDPTHTDNGCESLTEMVLRLSRILQKLDEEFADRILVLVSHGDPSIALFAMCSGVPPNERWTRVPHFKNCEVRELPNAM